MVRVAAAAGGAEKEVTARRVEVVMGSATGAEGAAGAGAERVVGTGAERPERLAVAAAASSGGAESRWRRYQAASEAIGSPRRLLPLVGYEYGLTLPYSLVPPP